MRAALFGVLALFAFASAADPSIVKLDSGGIRGYVGTKSRSFLGVPFAAPPVDDLRWQPPQTVKPWDGILNTTWYGNSCYQHSNAFTILTEISEDCLYLNVYTPYPIPAKPVPIMIFFYGGSWDTGAASFLLYNPDTDISLVEDVVVVTVNYRLNVFGFLASGALRSQDPDGSTGNYGLQDQRFAMEWVQRNGAAFGGDISRVTIFGESAGAGSVSNHLLQPKAWPYFHRAIVESGPISDWSAETFNRSASKYLQVATYLGCCSSLAACHDQDPNVLACLRQQNSSSLEAAGRSIKTGGGFLSWSPVIDGVEVLDAPLTLAAQGKIANVPVIFGTNADEGTEFNKCPKDLPSSQYQTYVTTTYGDQLGNAVVAQYPVADYENAFWATSRAIGDSQMSCYARTSARDAAASRANLTDAAPVYVYFFNHTLEVVQLFVPDKGCFHGSELVFVFDLTLGLWTEGEKALAQAFVKYWTSFAATGVPSFSGLPAWPAFTLDDQVTGVLDVNTILTPYPDLKKPFCDFWDANPVPPALIWG